MAVIAANRPVLGEEPQWCERCWQMPWLWALRLGGRYKCKVCDRFIGYCKTDPSLNCCIQCKRVRFLRRRRCDQCAEELASHDNQDDRLDHTRPLLEATHGIN